MAIANSTVLCLSVGITPCHVTGGSWSDKAIELLDSLSLCATWKVVMVMVEVKGEERSEIKIVDTTTDKDIDVAEQLVEEGMAEWSMEVCIRDTAFFGVNPYLPVTVATFGRR